MGGNPGLAGQPLGGLLPIRFGERAPGKLAEIAADLAPREGTTATETPALRLDKCEPTIECLFKANQLGFQDKGELKTELLKLPQMQLLAQAVGAGLMRLNLGHRVTPD